MVLGWFTLPQMRHVLGMFLRLGPPVAPRVPITQGLEEEILDM
jgi:hypothetical protein